MVDIIAQLQCQPAADARDVERVSYSQYPYPILKETLGSTEPNGAKVSLAPSYLSPSANSIASDKTHVQTSREPIQSLIVFPHSSLHKPSLDHLYGRLAAGVAAGRGMGRGLFRTLWWAQVSEYRSHLPNNYFSKKFIWLCGQDRKYPTCQ